nr:hypothetical protein [uncultured Prevotella sp.]
MEKNEKMRLQNIKQINIKYKQISLWLTAAMTLIILFACRVSAQCDDMIAQVVNPLVVSALFSIIASTAYGEAWKAIAKSSPANLAKFYLAALVFKMVAGTLVFLVYVLLCDKQNILGFTAIFALFYVALLVFDCIYFARVEKKSRLS